MPLWGGYAFRPWLFYKGSGEHPATEEYIFRDNHNNAVPNTYNFDPLYAPESRPYLCCEMGGGMFVSYNYRFQLPYESIDAMANIKIGSGCNMLGYYMFAGGTHPLSQRGGFLNEGQVPKRSYDFQAPIGEYGQIRNSYRRLRCLHLLATTFQDALCRMKTYLPQGSQDIIPTDKETLRWAVRMSNDGAGFVAINNYQDHADMLDKQDETILLHLPAEDITFENLSLAAGENCLLPFKLDIGGVLLRSAHAQPLAVLDGTAFFFAPEGMTPRYTFKKETEIELETGLLSLNDDFSQVDGQLPCFTAKQGNSSMRFITLSRADSLRFSVLDQCAYLCDGALMHDNSSLRIEYDKPEVALVSFKNGVFATQLLKKEIVDLNPVVKQVGKTRYKLDIPQWSDDMKDILLQIEYIGDIACAYIGNEMIADHFNNGSIWEIALREFAVQLKAHPMAIYITPFRHDSVVNVESTMAGRQEMVANMEGALISAKLLPIYEWHCDI